MSCAPLGAIYIGAPIELASERAVVAALAERLEQSQAPYIVIANAQIGGRQIDCIIATAAFVTVIEVKVSRTPIRGELNGAWSRMDASGDWRPYGNAYQQAVGAKNALRDAFSVQAPVGAYYPDACVIFAAPTPVGSQVTAGDFKARVATLAEFLADFPTGAAKRPPWAIDQWHAFATSMSLTAVKLNEAVGGDQTRRDTERLRLYNAAVAQEYGRVGGRWLHENGVPDALERAASEGGGCVIIGPSGCGKTLMAKSLASRLATAGSPVLYFAAKDFAGEWAKAIRREIGLLTDTSPAELLRAAANGDQSVFLIVDGVNELAGSEVLALRGLRALARRLDAKIVLTSQEAPVGFEGLSRFEVPRPSALLKRRIAERNGRRIAPSVADLLRAVGSGFEAEMVGDLGATLVGEATRLALIDQYIRTRLGTHARAGAFGLRQLAVTLHTDVAFSIAEPRFDELMRRATISFEACDGMFAAGLLVRRVGRVSFSHEMILNGCAAFGLADTGAQDPEALGMALSTPLLAPLAGEIVTAIEDPDTSMRVLQAATNPSLLTAAVAGSLGSVAASNARKLIQAAKQACIDEIGAVSLEFDQDNQVYVTRWGEAGRREWTPAEQARLGAMGQLATSLLGFQDYQDLCAIMDARLLEERLRLNPVTKAAGIGIRSPSFALAYYSMGDEIGFSYITQHGSRRSLGDVLEELPSLDVGALTSGQLHFYLENRRAFFGAEERGRFAKELILVLRERFSREPYHVQLAALSAVGFAREAPDAMLAELVEAINALDVPQHNWAINSSIIDALGILGALDDDAENARDGIRSQVAAALADGADGNDALTLYVAMFDHPFSTIYYEEIQALSEDQRRMLYRRALASAEIKRSLSLSWITAEVARLEDPADAPLFTRFVALPDRRNPFPQEEWGAFTLSLRFIGRHGVPLPASDAETEEEGCLNDIRILVHAAESRRPEHLAAAHDAWVRLDARPPGLVMGCLSEIHAALTERHWADDNRPYPPIDLRDTYPTESLRLARRFVEAAVDPQYFHAVPLWERGPELAFSTLGRFGDRSDVDVLRRLGRAHRYSSYALAALRTLDSAAAAP
ncbi:NERD domain-containing protein [uncultured Brevundimonas sp.]|uniref:NERD domain-containing protein n=1 Tax=uncultured Brevundimonas sp. TaxID=213418 RepID=UPI0025E55A3B|nr:NERD domain-containing protein [uncultured Brevundimonas sp.]